MKTAFSLSELQVLWVVGALERLATLGVLQDTPLQVSPDAIDLFLDLDENVKYLFADDEELKELTKVIIESESKQTSKEDINHILDYIVEYKNNRTKLVKDFMVFKEESAS